VLFNPKALINGVARGRSPGLAGWLRLPIPTLSGQWQCI